MFFLILACTGSTDHGAHATAKGLDNTLLQGSPGAVGVVRFLNCDSVSLPVLDDLVGLDRRAAKALMAHLVDHGDFNDITEVDDTWWVGPAALTKLEAYAQANGWVPTGDDELGTWDGVTFTVDQAELTLEYVNDAGEQELDDLLDRRSVDSIVAAGELETIHQLSELYWIGNYAMSTLKTEGAGEDEEAECELVVSSTSHAAAEAYSELLALTTTVDAPAAEVKTLQISGCRNWQDDADARAAVEAALWNEVFFLSYSEAGQYRDVRQVGEWVSGSRQYVQDVDHSLVIIDEHADDGDWDPNDGGQAAQLYDQVDELFEEIRDPMEADSSEWTEIDLYMDMIECSESATGIVNEAGEVFVAHFFQRC